MHRYNIAILLPCYNEAITIAQTIQAFKNAIPSAVIYVYDNASTDDTSAIAKQHGAIVHLEKNKGKGNVVRRQFADIDADIYVLADGDNTYDASQAPLLIQTLIDEQCDMVVGARSEACESSDKYTVYRRGHRFGNQLFTGIIAKLFGNHFQDVFSGYRIFSHRFVKSFPASACGFDIETEFTVHALELRLPSIEIKTRYQARPEGSVSKLNSFRDGIKILWRIVLLLKKIRPLFFFGIIFLLLFAAAVILFCPVFINYLHTGLVLRFPTAVLSTGIMLLAFMSLGCGIILDNVCTARREIMRLFYLSLNRLSHD
ncbi:MAG: glycosyl transferase [Gammaproteobacteria bacterium RIFCSPLOWO2_02_FULL_42_14]|nr:MAG: glycosyl transferase [Gammaproteobacteria bacterium RIFCSPHIGHO2_02_FULL_42_43]OGT28442.1 MAG: glycosyl transferase [Gammaproteobacteria bacterium RIFCSPHIGHO2_01_FULL_42_8]OGT51482.1 MAG: glycosyl transferase [Gammaproteobacteria bacterium RIFCSPHIGHO2_12_FULL_41_25]OGT62183.1 MAG: glycosyl transferase [Gammaproteobacteria bacterium RIFCSPLOWO2_02_FULL_42_14]OGT85856.1 MAG: glycosyl transferase [Gammaproteobacteria bacterium RIFCSPLOWO2_12_FULL_42_18]